MTIEQVEENLDEFFKNDKLKVLFLKGPWGSGKSFFMRSYLAREKSFVPSFQYVVSLFGLGTLNEVRETMNASLEIKGDADAGWKFWKKFNKTADFLKNTPTVYGISAASVSSIGNSLFWLIARKQKSLIIFDDLERSVIPPHTILGLASSLSENSKAKIIIIFNEKELSKDELSKVNEYREKVVDLEILFKPTVKTLVNNYLLEKQIREPISELLDRIDSPNIRLISKINLHLDQFKTLTAKHEVELSDEELIRTAKIVCLRYLSKRQITYPMLTQGAFGYFANKNEPTQEEKQLADLAKNLNMFPPFPLDGLALEIIQNGYCSEDSTVKHLEKHISNQSRDEFNADSMKAYFRFTSNFIATPDQVLSDMESFLNKYAGTFHPDHFLGHLKFLENIGYSKSVEPWKEKQLKLINRFPKMQDRLEAAQRLLPSDVASAFIAKTKQEVLAPTNPLELIKQITKSGSYHDDDCLSIFAMSEEEIFNWIANDGDESLLSTVREIRKYWIHGSDTAKEFCGKLDACLTRLGTRSKVDELRVKGFFGLEEIRIPIASYQ